jgi:ABC-type nitrate/sulfonate/bicarbonate transport system substrate-binding protein
MSTIKLDVMYGHLEGNAGAFARDPSGYLGIASGIFSRHGLDISWNHVQGTEARYRRLEDGRAHISLVVGRASLQHFLDTGATRVIGCVMNSCPYLLMVNPAIARLAELRGKTMACRDAPARNTRWREALEEAAGLRAGRDLDVQLSGSDQAVYESLIRGTVQAALLPRPFGFWAEERGFLRVPTWPATVDDPLPITIETSARLWRERSADLARFVAAHRETVAYFKAQRDKAIELLRSRFGHSPVFAAKTFDDYVICMDHTLQVDFAQLELLLSQVIPDRPVNARETAERWLVPGALKGQPPLAPEPALQ